MKRTAYLFPAILLVRALAGCGDVVTESTATSSATATASGSGGESAAASSSSGGVTTGSGGAGGACSEPSDALTINLVTSDNTAYGCNTPGAKGTGDFEIRGQVHMINPGVAAIDSCPPNADCGPSLSTLSIKAANYQLSLPEGAYVTLRLHLESPMGCGAKILITSLESWFNLPNPVTGLDPLLLAASDGLDSTFPEAPFAMDRVQVCTMGIAGGAKAFAFRFFTAGDPPGSGITVSQGPGVIWPAPFQKNGPLAIRNLRSYESGFADDYWNWSYLITPALVGK